ncbi:MAG: helix-turn-helix domain-containing protein [Clostridia bacterium]|jgi:transcriptional regulator with XRE-family HTH domain
MYAENFKQVGENIRQALKNRGMTRQQLADRLGISEQAVNRIINGKKAINIMELSQVASILDISPDELLSVKNPIQMENKKQLFTDELKNEEVHRNIDFLRNVIDQIRILEDLIHEQDQESDNPMD